MKSIKSLFSIAVALIMTFVIGAFAAQAMGAPEYATKIALGVASLSFLPKPTGGGLMFVDASPDLTAISKYAVSFKSMLLRRFYNALDIANDITLQPNVKNKMPLPMLTINGQARPYTGNHKSTASDISYSDRELVVDDFQRDILIDPSYYRNTYLAVQRGKGESASNKTIPFAQFTLESIVDHNASILNNQTAFYGLGKAAFSAFNAASTYSVGAKITFSIDNELHYFVCKTATSAAESPSTHPAKWTLADALAITEGLGTKLKAGRTAGTITNVVTTGAITSSNAYLKAIEVYRKLPEEVRNQGKDLCLYASSDSVDLILDSYETDILKFTKTEDGSLILPRTGGKCKIVRASWMNGSKMLFAGPRSNFYMGTDQLSDVNDLLMIPDVYTLKGGLKGLMGFQYADPNAISMNDQD